RILHGDVAIVGEDRLQLIKQLLPPRILALAARECIKVSGLNLVKQFPGFAVRRDQVEPAPGDHLPRGQPQHAVGDRIAMMVIIKKPGVDVTLAECGLDGGKIHGQVAILNNEKVLGELALAWTRSHKDSITFDWHWLAECSLHKSTEVL